MNLKSLLVWFPFLANICFSQAVYALVLKNDADVNFGEKYQFSELTHELQVKNDTSDNVVLKASSTNPPDVAFSFAKQVLSPGESTSIRVKASLGDRAGVVSIPATFETNENNAAKSYRFVFKGFVDTIFSDGPKLGVDLGTIDATLSQVNHAFVLRSELEPGFELTKILEKPDFLDVAVSEDKKALELTPINLKSTGLKKGFVTAELKSAIQSKVRVAVSVDVHGDVVPDQNPLDMQFQRFSKRLPIRLQLSSRSGHQFHVGNVIFEKGTNLSAKVSDCLPKSADCQALMISIGDQLFGRIIGAFSVELPDSKEVLHENVFGIYLSDDTKVQSLDALLTGGGRAQQSTTDTATNLSDAFKDAVDQSSDMPAGHGPLLRWQVANEGGIYGYAVFRSNSVDGKYARINQQILASKNKGDNVTASYQYRDTSAESGKEYWYYITIFYNSGKKVQLTGPQKVVAK